MFLLVNQTTTRIHGASNRNLWSSGLAGYTVREVRGDAETYLWPNGEPVRCLLMKDLTIMPDPSWSAPPDPGAELEAALVALDTDATAPAAVKRSIVALAAALDARRAVVIAS